MGTGERAKHWQTAAWSPCPTAAADGCLVSEVHRAGHEVELNTKGRRAKLLLTVDGITREIHVSEEYDQVRHQPTPEELRAAKRNPWTARIPDFDSVPSGRLRVTMQRSYDKRDEWTGLQSQDFQDPCSADAG